MANRQVYINAVRGNEIDVKDVTTNEEGTLKIVGKALDFISRVKTGKAEIGMFGQDVNYVKMLDGASTYKKPYGQKFTPQAAFKQATQINDFEPRGEPQKHYQNVVKVYESITLPELEQVYNALSSVEWTTATQWQPVESLKAFKIELVKKLDEAKLLTKEITAVINSIPARQLINAAVYSKVLKDGPRTNSTDTDTDY